MFPFAALVVGRRRNPIKLLFTNSIDKPSSFLNSSQLLLLSCSLHLKSQEEPIQKDNHSSSLTTVTYLMSSCGLSPQSALSASKRINIKTTTKPDSNLALFKSHGFSDTQITKLISASPQYLLAEWDKSIKPKLDYLLSVVCSEADLPALVTSHPVILGYSLERKIKHNVDLLRPIFSTKQQLAAAVRRSSGWLLTDKLETNFLPNVRILQSYGIPAPNIVKLAAGDPRNLMGTSAAHFKTTVESIRKMGFNPLSTMFVQGIRAVTSMKPSIWERKVAFYKSKGWSEADFSSAFRKHPLFMSLSEEKVKRVMDFVAEKMNWGPSFLAAHPALLDLSLEKRIIPRCLTMRTLMSKGLMENMNGVYFLTISETVFLNKYVIKYQDQVPELLQIYKGNSEFVGL